MEILTQEPLVLDGTIPLIIVVHGKFTQRVRYYRTVRDIQKGGFVEGSEGVEGEVARMMGHLLMENPLVALGRAEEGESLKDAMRAILGYERAVICPRTMRR